MLLDYRSNAGVEFQNQLTVGHHIQKVLCWIGRLAIVNVLTTLPAFVAIIRPGDRFDFASHRSAQRPGPEAAGRQTSAIYITHIYLKPRGDLTVSDYRSHFAFHYTLATLTAHGSNFVQWLRQQITTGDYSMPWVRSADNVGVNFNDVYPALPAAEACPWQLGTSTGLIGNKSLAADGLSVCTEITEIPRNTCIDG